MVEKIIRAKNGRKDFYLKPKMKNEAAGKLLAATPLDWSR
jgi:hypothetical protein